MKKVFTLLLTLGIVSLFIFGTSSCTRTYTCRCVLTYTGQPGLPDTTVRNYTIKDTKTNARDICNGNSRVYKEGDITTTEDCDLW